MTNAPKKNKRNSQNMKVVLAGAYGKLGVEILKELVKQGHEVVAADMVEKEVQDLDTSKVTFKKINVTDKATLSGLCEGAEEQLV